MLSFGTKPLSPAMGAEVTGLDLSNPLDDETVAALRETWLEHQVLLFRGQALNARRQLRFARCFGEPVVPRATERFVSQPDYDPGIMLIGNIREDGRIVGSLPDGELQFHSDPAFLENPLMATLLYGVDIPSRGGNTLFANTCAAYEALPADMKQRLEGLKAVNTYDYSTQVRSGRLDREKVPCAEHPVIRTHPETGRKAIYVNRLMTEEIVGLPETESTVILNRLFDLVERHDFCYEHVWRKGDLLMWDNRCAQHARTDFPPQERRLLKRVGLTGDRPV